MNAEPVVMRRRIVRTIGIAVIAALATSACAAGRDAQTANQSASLDGTNKTVGQIDLRALSIQAPPVGKPSYPVGGSAQITVVLVNTGRSVDTLQSISTPSAADWGAFGNYSEAYQVQQATNGADSQTPAPSSAPASATAPSPAGSASSAAPLPTGAHQVIVRPGVRTSFGTPEATGALLLTGLKKPLFAGNSISVTFTFDHAGPITISVPVQITSVPAVKVGGPAPSPTGQQIP
ncbi:MAG: hypothetical protein ABI345_15600 [Jatrophihabitans sp.]